MSSPSISGPSSMFGPPPPPTVLRQPIDENSIIHDLIPCLHDDSFIDTQIEVLLYEFTKDEILYLFTIINNKTQKTIENGIDPSNAIEVISDDFDDKFRKFLNFFFDELMENSYNNGTVFITLRLIFIKIIKNPTFYKCINIVQLYSIISILNAVLQQIKEYINSKFHAPLGDISTYFNEAAYKDFQTVKVNDSNGEIDAEIGKYNLLLVYPLTNKKKKDYTRRIKRLEKQKTKLLYTIVINLIKLIKHIELMIVFTKLSTVKDAGEDAGEDEEDAEDAGEIEEKNDNLIDIILNFTNTQNHLKEMFYGDFFKPGKKITIRSWVEYTGATTQCNNTITKREQLFPGGSQFSCSLDEAERHQEDPNYDLICYICGCPLYNAPKAIQCEHVLPLFAAARFFCVYVSNMNVQHFEINLKYEYKWSHICCNQVKSSTDFIIEKDDKYIIDEERVKGVFKKIYESLSMDNKNCNDMPTETRDCISSKFGNEANYDDLIKNLEKRLGQTIDFLNVYYRNTKAQINKMINSANAKLQKDMYAGLTLIRCLGIILKSKSTQFLQSMIFSSTSKDYTLNVLKNEIGKVININIKSFDLVGFLFEKLDMFSEFPPILPGMMPMGTTPLPPAIQQNQSDLLKLLDIVYNLFDRISNKIVVVNNECPRTINEIIKTTSIYGKDKIIRTNAGTIESIKTFIDEEYKKPGLVNTTTEMDEIYMLSFIFWSLFNNYLFCCTLSATASKNTRNTTYITKLDDCSYMYKELFDINCREDTNYLINIWLQKRLDNNYEFYKEYLDKLNCLLHLLNSCITNIMLAPKIKIKVLVRSPNTKKLFNRIELKDIDFNNNNNLKIPLFYEGFKISVNNNMLYTSIEGVSDTTAESKFISDYTTIDQFNKNSIFILKSVNEKYNQYKAEGDVYLQHLSSFIFSTFKYNESTPSNPPFNIGFKGVNFDFMVNYPILPFFDAAFITSCTPTRDIDILEDEEDEEMEEVGGSINNKIMVGGLDEDERIETRLELLEESYDEKINNADFKLEMKNQYGNNVSILKLKQKDKIVYEEYNRSIIEDVKGYLHTQSPSFPVTSSPFAKLKGAVKAVIFINRLTNAVQQKLKRVYKLDAKFTISVNPPQEITENTLIPSPEVKTILENKQIPQLNRIEMLINVNYNQFDKLIYLSSSSWTESLRQKIIYVLGELAKNFADANSYYQKATQAQTLQDKLKLFEASLFSLQLQEEKIIKVAKEVKNQQGAYQWVAENSTNRDGDEYRTIADYFEQCNQLLITLEQRYTQNQAIQKQIKDKLESLLDDTSNTEMYEGVPHYGEEEYTQKQIEQGYSQGFGAFPSGPNPGYSQEFGEFTHAPSTGLGQGFGAFPHAQQQYSQPLGAVQPINYYGEPELNYEDEQYGQEFGAFPHAPSTGLGQQYSTFPHAQQQYSQPLGAVQPINYYGEPELNYEDEQYGQEYQAQMDKYKQKVENFTQKLINLSKKIQIHNKEYKKIGKIIDKLETNGDYEGENYDNYISQYNQLEEILKKLNNKYDNTLQQKEEYQKHVDNSERELSQWAQPHEEDSEEDVQQKLYQRQHPSTATLEIGNKKGTSSFDSNKASFLEKSNPKKPQKQESQQSTWGPGNTTSVFKQQINQQPKKQQTLTTSLFKRVGGSKKNKRKYNKKTKKTRKHKKRTIKINNKMVRKHKKRTIKINNKKVRKNKRKQKIKN